ncbi:NADH-quinone oxidoreductase subunit G [Nocardioides marmoriginsengisoli]|uniref:NADH-quinone oxidoreductase n=1 Tax=Nocardioides marmoriginsengisoli TaxID=661483 RepID=A0A3N0CFR7_9ACTN|nr:NADH-quinone oxidoreductase subunit G [Nocardioides marmoriginsengisoli]RNL62304.1 NADH-quinone oxidoreductase subunit G [Nocardioides marmoriginsengisoli]
MTQAPEKAVTKTDEVSLTIDGVQVSVPKDTLVIRAAEQVGVQIPRFCDHPLLAPVGACRQCLVDVPDAGNGRGFPKPQASCTLPVAEGMVVNTQATSPVAEKAQHGVMEFLLINHPLDCPVCDKGGECPLQNQAMSNGQGESRFAASGGTKRVFPKPINLSPQVLLDRERCIVCQRCTRFAAEIAGDPFIELVERGAQQQIGIAEGVEFLSYFSGNTIQICPVGALTSAAYRFRSRPFDLVSTPSVADLDACGSAIRVDHRRGKVMRRLAGDDAEVNEEWITDKDRFAFASARQDDRLTHPMVRDADTGELRAASWPEAFVVAARGLEAAKKKVGLLPGGRLTVEDAYAWSKFARVTVRTNNIDFRAREHSAEEAEFLAAAVALTGPDGGGITYADLESARTVVLAGLDPEDEAGAIFLRLRKANQARGTRVFSVSAVGTRGLRKMGGTLLPTVPGTEAAAIAAVAENGEVALDAGGVILVGERLATVPGALSAAVRLAATTGARLAWVPRRAGDRGAVEAGCLPNLLPGGRPAADPAARVDLAAAWGVQKLPDNEGLDGAGILDALLDGDLRALVVGGVDPADVPVTKKLRKALKKAFVVSLEVRASAFTELADVVFPVAPSSDKAGSFVNWEGRVRSFPKVLDNPSSLPDVRVLAGIAEERGRSLGFRTVEQVAAEMSQVGAWEGPRPEIAPVEIPRGSTSGDLVLSSWKQSVDDGRMQDGDEHLRATARPPVVLVNQATLAGLGVSEGDTVTLAGPLGSIALPVAVGEVADGSVWAPASAPGASVRHLVGPAGSTVTISGTTEGGSK